MITFTSTGQRVLFGLLSAVFFVGIVGSFFFPGNLTLECMHLAPYGIITGAALGGYAMPALRKKIRKGYHLAVPIFVLLSLSLVLSISSALSKPSLLPFVAFSLAMIVGAVAGFRRTRQTVALHAA